jgi:hypothetical protein
MISYIKKNRFVKIKINWFEYDKGSKSPLGFNAHFHLKNVNGCKIPGVRKDSHTIEIDLTQSEEALFAGFSKQVKQQYKTSEKEGVHCYFHEDIDHFVDFFNDFASKRNTYPTSRQRIEEMGSMLKLSFAEIEGKVLVAHSYMEDEKVGIARIHHSATTRLDESMDKNLVGRAHKYLTVKNILHYKARGFKVLDLGGYAANTTDPGLLGINKFKEMFGGKVVPCINYFSYSYWLVKQLAKSTGIKSDV